MPDLLAPYPAPRPDRQAVGGALFFGAFVTVFLGYFRPFGLADPALDGRPVEFIVYGLIAAVACLVLEVLLPFLLPRLFRDDDWRVWHRIAYYLLLLFVIATGNGLYINARYDLTFNWANYGLITGQTLSLGVLPITMLVLYRYNARRAFFLEQALKLRQPAAPTGTVTSTDTPLAAEAFGNYVKLYFPDGAEARRVVERTTLGEVAERYATAGLLRCHRSWVVDVARVTAVSGNAQGLNLTVDGFERTIPVSRSYLATVRAVLEGG